MGRVTIVCSCSSVSYTGIYQPLILGLIPELKSVFLVPSFPLQSVFAKSRKKNRQSTMAITIHCNMV